MDCCYRLWKTTKKLTLLYDYNGRNGLSPKSGGLNDKEEMRVLRSIVGVTLRDRLRNDGIRQRLGVEDVVLWTRQRRRGWNEHVDRMGNDRLPCRDKKPNTTRPWLDLHVSGIIWKIQASGLI